jgi:hypothetical protein
MDLLRNKESGLHTPNTSIPAAIGPILSIHEKRLRRLAMTQTRLLKTAGVITAFAAIILAGMMNNSRRVRARGVGGTG